MADVRVAKRYDVPGRQMWERVGDPGKLAEWHPYIERTESRDGGKARVNTTGEGARVAETILEQGERHYAFRIDDGPLPYDDFVSTIRVRDEDDGGCVVEWDATLEPKGLPEPEVVEMTRGFFQAGLDALASFERTNA